MLQLIVSNVYFQNHAILTIFEKNQHTQLRMHSIFTVAYFKLHVQEFIKIFYLITFLDGQNLRTFERFFKSRKRAHYFHSHSP